MGGDGRIYEVIEYMVSSPIYGLVSTGQELHFDDCSYTAMPAARVCLSKKMFRIDIAPRPSNFENHCQQKPAADLTRHPVQGRSYY